MKHELGALIAACRREHVFCACVMHGHGKHILKQQTPLWLAQHPHVMALSSGTKNYGGDAALLVLIAEEWLPPGCLRVERVARCMVMAGGECPGPGVSKGYNSFSMYWNRQVESIGCATAGINTHDHIV